MDEAATKSSRKMEFGGGTPGWKKTFFIRVCRGRLVGISWFDGCFQHSKKPQMMKKKNIGFDWFQMAFNIGTTGWKKTVFRVRHSVRLFGCDLID